MIDRGREDSKRISPHPRVCRRSSSLLRLPPHRPGSALPLRPLRLCGSSFPPNCPRKVHRKAAKVAKDRGGECRSHERRAPRHPLSLHLTQNFFLSTFNVGRSMFDVHLPLFSPRNLATRPLSWLRAPRRRHRTSLRSQCRHHAAGGRRSS